MSRRVDGVGADAVAVAAPSSKKELCEFTRSIDSYFPNDIFFLTSGEGLRFLMGVRPFGTGCGDRGPSILTDSRWMASSAAMTDQWPENGSERSRKTK